ncbi:MAG TPA: putative molybdenum carrier protein [Pirellulaceae bacterium]|nr:putative molybdenum carrier protein [Pirellulaceae bacterium]HMO91462.1 putative molybdenum carrier protein [Pirellulaceae bacterium]HMP69461.1 putative molybdenum carrier protein [Pirellulaceae bacterium]
MLRKIISGGQTGVDRGALDAAIEANFEHGGWCPRGRIAEDGPIEECYSMRETPTRDYAERTERNVIESDGTLILYDNKIQGGTRLTKVLALQHQRPFHAVNLGEPIDFAAIVAWIESNNIAVLNVAGPRESGSPGIGNQARNFVFHLLQLIRENTSTN